MEFFAFTVNVYASPLVNPDRVQVKTVTVQLSEPGVEVTVYSVTEDPPLFTGATQLNVAWEFDTSDTVGAPGASGAPRGVTATEAVLDVEEAPAELVFFTVNVWGVPLVNPVTVHVIMAVVQVLPPGFAVTR